jgi:hypothetical protein
MYIDEGTNKLFQIKIKLEIFNINLLDWIFLLHLQACKLNRIVGYNGIVR